MTITDLDRNDVEGALRVRREGVAAGTWTADQAEAILQLQDDSTELIRRLSLEPSRASDSRPP